MKFLTWSDRTQALNSLEAVNGIYNCPFVGQTGYRLDQWDTLIESVDKIKLWGFYEPKTILGSRPEDFLGVMISGFAVHDEKPDSFKIIKEEL